MKKLLGITLLTATLVTGFAAVRRLMSGKREAEREQFRRDLERFEGEGGATAG